MNQSVDLSIIIPSKNESDRIADSLSKLAAFLDANRKFDNVEVIVITPASDPTAAVAKSKTKLFNNLRVIEFSTSPGKGGSVRLAMLEARGRYRLFMDADLATPLKHLNDVYDLMQRHGDVGIAVRDLWRIHEGLLRKTITKVANLVVQILLVPGIKDTQCGFKVFSARAAEAIFPRQRLTKWSFDVEVLKIARLLGYKIEYIEAPDWKDPKKVGLAGESPLKIAIQEFKDPFVILFNVISGKYKHKTYHL